MPCLLTLTLRLPKLHIEFGGAPSPGLSDYLRGALMNFPYSAAMARILFFIPAGKGPGSNPTELLWQHEAEELVRAVNTLGRLVIVTRRRIAGGGRRLVLAPICDGVNRRRWRGQDCPPDRLGRACQSVGRAITGVGAEMALKMKALGSPYAYYGRSEHVRG